jgi:hypothetical protein
MVFILDKQVAKSFLQESVQGQLLVRLAKQAKTSGVCHSQFIP